MALGTFDLVSKLRNELSGRRLLPPLSSSSPPLPAAIDGILEDLEEVEASWRMVQSVVADAEEREIREISVREWLRDLRDLAYMVEDVLDLYQYQLVADQVQVETNEVCPLEDLSFWLDIAERVAKIKQCFDDISRGKELLALNEPDGMNWKEANNSIACLLPKIPIRTGSELIGRKEQCEELLRLLQENCAEELEVIAIVGMGGSGKTSLAHHIFQHLKDVAHFSLVGWVSVPENCSFTRLHSEIAYVVDKSVDRVRAEHAIWRSVFREKFFLVMDGMGRSQVENWNKFLKPFGGFKKGSKILITTREEAVAQAAGASSFIKLGGLSEDEGWSLLQQHAFPNPEEECPLQLMAIGKDIVKRCRGLPITLKVLGRFLRTVKDDEDIWRRTVESDVWDIVQIAGSGEQVLGPLYFSYLRMPSHLRACFRYCSIFQRGEFIDRKKLVEFWLVNNLITDDHGVPLNEVADGYIDDLESRSFLDYVSDPNGNEGYVIHNLLVDILQFISGEEFCIVQGIEWSLPPHARHARLLEESKCPETHFLHSVSDEDLECTERRQYSIHATSGLRTIWVSGPAVWRGEPPSSVQISNGSSLRILSSLNVSVSNLDECLAESKLLRVVAICFDINDGGYYYPDDYDDWENVKGFELESLPLLYNLRQLNLRHFPIDDLPSSISNLRSLMNLDISETRIGEIPEAVGALQKLSILKLRDLKIKGLPESLGELSNLEVLDIRGCKEFSELPRGITNLTNLQSLNVADSGSGYMPSGISKLERLRDLPIFRVGKGEDGHAGIGELKNMAHLEGMLDIFGLENVIGKEVKECAMSNKHLHQLKLVWSWNCDSPGTSEEPKELMEVELMLEELRPHTNIKELNISGYKGIRLPIWMGDTSFANLVKLNFELFANCTSISSLERLPSLENLRMVQMASLTELASVQSREDVSFPKLKELVVSSCDSLKFVPLYKFSSLISLKIEQCQLLEKIDLMGSSGRPLDFLKTVEFRYCDVLSFPNDVLLPLTLKSFTSVGCDALEDWVTSNRDSIMGHVGSVVLNNYQCGAWF